MDAGSRRLTEEQKRRAQEAWDRIDAGQRFPTGTWAQRWLPTWTPWGCWHEKVRCIHGDEINARNGRRRLCMVCGRALKGPLPLICWYSGQPHPSRVDG